MFCRKQMLSDVVRLYKEGCYGQMADILMTALQPDEHKVNLEIVQSSLDRSTQFNLLLEACWEMKQYEVSLTMLLNMRYSPQGLTILSTGVES